MLHEYAIEPAALTRFETSRYILEKMGIHKGRYISQFPGNWFNAVRQACYDDDDCLDITRAKIMILLKKASSCVLTRHHRYFDIEMDWLSNAEHGHALEPFHAILAKDNPRELDYVLPIDEITEEHPLLEIPRECIVSRTAAELLNVVRPFLELAKEIVFVDGYFNPLDQKYQNTTKAFLNTIKTSGNSVNRIEYHTRGDRRGDGLSAFVDFQQACMDKLSGVLPPNMQLKISRWNQRKGGIRFHARYILTNIGGLRIDSGLDEAFGPGQDTDISILDQTTYNEIWQRFSDPSPYFDISDAGHVTVQ